MAISRKRRKTKSRGVSFLILRSREIGAAEFKARCLELVGEVERTNAEVIITRHRKPVARLVPVSRESERFCGSLNVVLEERDILSPIDVKWEADETNPT